MAAASLTHIVDVIAHSLGFRAQHPLAAVGVPSRDRHESFSWMHEGLPEPGTLRIADVEHSAVSWIWIEIQVLLSLTVPAAEDLGASEVMT